MKHSIIKRFLFISILMAFAAFPGQAGIIYVNSNLSAIGNGSSWPTAYKHLQDALDAAVSGDEIWVVQGYYYPDLKSMNGLTIDSNDPTDSFNMKTGVQILGGFIGNENTANDRNPDPSLTILSGQINTNINSNHVITVDNVENVIIDGLTIRDGFAKRTTETIPRGGAIIIDNNSSVYLNQVYFTNNKCEYYGAGIFLDRNSYASVINCSFIENASEYVGGAICISRDARANILNSNFTNNSSRGNGGAIDAQSNTLEDDYPITIDNCTFTGNKCKYEGFEKIGFGGAIKLFSFFDANENYTPFIVSNCKFYNNSATGEGGAIASSGSSLIENCLFVGNESDIEGGGIHVNIYWATQKRNRINNCTFHENSGSIGNSISIRSDNPSIPVKITNSILWGSDTNPQIGSNNPDNIDITYSNIKGGYEGIGNIDDAPQFTMDYHLAGNSPSLNTGNNYVDNLPEFDLDGNDRIICSAVDMGAYETYMSECDVIHVKWDVGIVPEYQDGEGWLSAYDNLQSALDVAEDGDQIWIASGTYKPSTSDLKSDEDLLEYLELFEPELLSQFKSNQDPSEILKDDQTLFTFRLNKNISIYGGFFGNETDIDQRDIETYTTILSGEIGTPSTTDNCKNVVTAYSSSIILDGLTLSHASSNASGAALRTSTLISHIENCRFTENYSSAIRSYVNSEFTISNSKIIENSSIGLGGGILSASSIYNIKNSEISYNAGGQGGAIWAYESNINLTNCLLTNNITTDNGAAIYNNNSNIIIDLCTFAENYNNTEGSGIKNMPTGTSQLNRITNSIFWNNVRCEQLIGTTSEFDVDYSNIQLIDSDENTTFDGTDNLNTDPFFVDASINDFRLQTNASSSFGTPLLSNECSPCIDAGNPLSPYDNEPTNGNNSRVNMGRYGNTEFAANPCASKKETKSANTTLNGNISNSEISISPNPFSENMNFNISATKDSNIEIYIYNSSGRQVKAISSQLREGQNQINWDGNSEYGSKLPKGIYLAKIKFQNKISTEKIIIN